jgi:transcription termination/antitermination protein NusG
MPETRDQDARTQALLSDAALGGAVRWRVLHCRGRQEKKVVEVLAATGIEYYLPIVKRERLYGHRRREVELPLFSGYVFMHGVRESAFELIAAKRVVAIVEVRDQTRFEHELTQIRKAVAGGAYLDPCPTLRTGWRVRVRTGAFMGVEGLVEKKPRPDRLVLQIDVLGQAVSLDISAFEVEVLGPPLHPEGEGHVA